jgi:hypothetical protein
MCKQLEKKLASDTRHTRLPSDDAARLDRNAREDDDDDDDDDDDAARDVSRVRLARSPGVVRSW